MAWIGARWVWGVCGAALLVALMIVPGLVPLAAQAQAQPQPQDSQVVSVWGEAVVAAPPDRVTVDVAVVSDAASAGEALAANSAALAAVMQVLARRDVPAGDVQTQQFDVSPVYQHEEGHRASRLVGFQVVNRVRVSSGDLEGLGTLLDELVREGANRIEGIQFSVHDPTALLDRARAAAVADARRRAERYAHAAGVRLGRVLSIDESGGGSPGPVQRLAMAERAVSIAPGQLELRVNIAVRYALGPALEPARMGD